MENTNINQNILSQQKIEFLTELASKNQKRKLRKLGFAIAKYEDKIYIVNETGTIIINNYKIKKQSIFNGYITAGNVYAHILVTLAFIGPKPSDFHEVNHIDGNPLNNHHTNLEWVTHFQNINWGDRSFKASIGIGKSIIVYNKITFEIYEYQSITEACVKLKLTRYYINKLINSNNQNEIYEIIYTNEQGKKKYTYQLNEKSFDLGKIDKKLEGYKFTSLNNVISPYYKLLKKSGKYKSKYYNIRKQNYACSVLDELLDILRNNYRILLFYKYFILTDIKEIYNHPLYDYFILFI